MEIKISKNSKICLFGNQKWQTLMIQLKVILSKADISSLKISIFNNSLNICWTKWMFEKVNWTTLTNENDVICEKYVCMAVDIDFNMISYYCEIIQKPSFIFDKQVRNSNKVIVFLLRGMIVMYYCINGQLCYCNAIALRGICNKLDK